MMVISKGEVNDREKLRQVNKGSDSDLGNKEDDSRRQFFKITHINGSSHTDRGPSTRRYVIYVGIALMGCLSAMSVNEKSFRCPSRWSYQCSGDGDRLGISFQMRLAACASQRMTMRDDLNGQRGGGCTMIYSKDEVRWLIVRTKFEVSFERSGMSTLHSQPRITRKGPTYWREDRVETVIVTPICHLEPPLWWRSLRILGIKTRTITFEGMGKLIDWF